MNLVELYAEITLKKNVQHSKYMIKNKKIILIIIIIAFVLGLAGYWFFLKEEKPEFSLEKVALATVVKEISDFVGCIAGYLPARSASKLNPVDALRYE